MNYQSAASGGFGVDGQMLPIGDDWRRVAFALAGYGYVVPGTISEAVPAQVSSVVSKTCTITMDIEGGY